MEVLGRGHIFFCPAYTKSGPDSFIDIRPLRAATHVAVVILADSRSRIALHLHTNIHNVGTPDNDGSCVAAPSEQIARYAERTDAQTDVSDGRPENT